MLRFITKKSIVHDQYGNAENRYKPNKQIRFKKSMLQSDLCNYSNAYNFVNRIINVTDSNNNAYDNKLASKKMHNSLASFQKFIVYLLTMQKN